MAKVTVLGAGMMGSALCVPLVDAGHQVRLVGTHLDGEIVQSLTERGYHPKLGLELPRSIRPYPIEALDQAMEGVELVGVGVSSAGVRWAGERLAPFLRPGLPLVMITKGLDWNGRTIELLPDVLTLSWPDDLRRAVHPASVAGPCIAGELAHRVPSCVVLTGRESAGLERLRSSMSTSYYHVFVNPDLVGVQLCAALKNAYALGVGLAAGLHEARGGQAGSVAMHNYEAAVFAQAMLETERWVTALGGASSTVMGLAGTGDLTVTCNGGRTSRFGRWLGLGLGIEAAIDRMAGATLECLDILRVLSEAMPTLEKRGLLRPSQVPLLVHLMDVTLAGAPIDLPFARFFGPA
jgi:glycerol-3-phosphate dehydrogenase (NAD(P)+)